MDPTALSALAGGGLAPFLVKTYEMVDDSATDEIVSWSSNNKSFVVWDPPEFARLLLPTYFKHNNFSSFIRQLNTYGFHKIDPERWEFANEDFVKDGKHLLKNIHRKKPIRSHSSPQCSSVDLERAGFEEEIEKLSRERTALEAHVLRFRQERKAGKHQMQELTLRAHQMERRQQILFNFLEKAVQHPTFVQHLVCKIESMDVAAYNKKRRLPRINQTEPVGEDCLVDNNKHSSRAEFGNIFHQDFSNNLRLELSPAISDINLVSPSSDEDGESPQRRISEGESKDEGLSFAPETLDVSCLLNLTLASASLQVNRSPSLTMMSELSQEFAKASESRSNTRAFENSRNVTDGDATLYSSKEGGNTTTQEPAAPLNDVFWEHFLTERPGSSDDESNSNHQANPYDEEDKSSSHGLAVNAKNMEQLRL